MPKFRKKPVEIEAMQFSGGWSNAVEIMNWAKIGDDMLWSHASGDSEGQIEIITLEGVMNANPGDWIIRGVKGEIYPCKPDIFAATYDEVRP